MKYKCMYLRITEYVELQSTYFLLFVFFFLYLLYIAYHTPAQHNTLRIFVSGL